MDTTQITTDILTIVSNAFLAIMQILIPALLIFLGEMIRRKLGAQALANIQKQISLHKDLALMAVRYAEQAYKDQNGSTKYKAAAKYLSDKAFALGLKITEADIEGLVENALRTIKDELGDTWSNTVKAPEVAPVAETPATS